MQFNMHIPIEQLIHLKCDGEAENAYSVHCNFIVSWVDPHILCITARQQMPNLAETGKILGLLWEHQMYSLDEWCFIQIALNRSGCICFLCRIQEGLEREYNYIIGIIKMIDDTFKSQICKI